jgi:beta-lactamase superfamily II metal-dependent hydrolase
LSTLASICETIIFGRGTGESILMHLQDNEWLITDSCLNDQNKPAALEYLKEQGVDPAEHVKLIIISHFHDDHISGMLETILTCKKARVHISAALTKEEFVRYIYDFKKLNEVNSKTNEFSRLCEHFQTSDRKDLDQVMANTCLYTKNNITIHALSPCNEDMQESRDDFVHHAVNANNNSEVLLSLPKGKPNHYCVVLRIYDTTSHQQNDILLGADLEKKRNRGWDKVCTAICAPINKKVGVFKIPHHGSETGYHTQTWNSLINDTPIGVITTYDNSLLPRQGMIDTYSARTKELYCTSDPNKGKSVVENKAINKILKNTSSSVLSKGANDRYGAVIVKHPMTVPVVTLLGAAVNLK